MMILRDIIVKNIIHLGKISKFKKHTKQMYYLSDLEFDRNSCLQP